MDIVLNTIFNNPNLPKIPIYGFNDDFNRASADTLGMTAEGKPWMTLDAGSAVGTWGTTGNGTAKMKSAASQTHTAVVDAGASDGRLVAKLANFNTALSSNRFGIALRVQNMQNYIALQSVWPGSSGWGLIKYASGTFSAIGTLATAPSPGDTVEVTLSGESIIVKSNGSQIISATVPEMVDVTRHGMFAFAGSDAEWDSIQFIPA